jgi:hypothetical protein
VKVDNSTAICGRHFIYPDSKPTISIQYFKIAQIDLMQDIIQDGLIAIDPEPFRIQTTGNHSNKIIHGSDKGGVVESDHTGVPKSHASGIKVRVGSIMKAAEKVSNAIVPQAHRVFHQLRKVSALGSATYSPAQNDVDQGVCNIGIKNYVHIAIQYWLIGVIEFMVEKILVKPAAVS